MLKIFTKIVLFILLLLIIVSCNVVKHVSDGEYLLEKNTILVNSKKKSALELQNYLHQKPNQKILGIPFSLHLYNWGNPDTTKISWPDNRPEMKKWLSKTFSDKQVQGLRRFSKGFNNWKLKSGNAPVISDIKKVEKSALALERYYANNGFWDAIASFKENKKKRKKLRLNI